MTKKCIYTALAFVMLLCSACGKQSDIPSSETAASDAAGIPDGNMNADTSGNDESTDTVVSENNTDSAQAAENTQQPLSISIELQTQKNDAAEEGTLIYSSVIIYPVVSIEGNEAAADKINADIQARVDAFLSDTILLDSAKEMYRTYPAEDSAYPFIEYSSDLDFTVKRADSNVISFTAMYYEFAGGAHGNTTTIGINYSPQTGELIPFAELGQEPDAFHADTFAFLQELAATEDYQERLFPSTSPEEIEAVLYGGESWYLSESGLVFISDPYALGPYVAGLIEFTIPYDALEEMGLKEEYQYEGNLYSHEPCRESFP